LGIKQFQEQPAVDVAVPILDGHDNEPEGKTIREETFGPVKGKHQNIGAGH
jgi:hypothetical protein